MPCFAVRGYDLTMKSGGDAHVALHDVFTVCKEFAPCVMVIDPLTAVMPENPSRRIDRSASDNELVGELKRILAESKRVGVTVVGVTCNEEYVMKSVLRCFDETVRQVGSCHG